MSKFTKHHLGPNGWVECEERPADAVESWQREYRVFDGKPHIDYAREWADPHHSPEQLKALRDSFPLPESRVSARDAEIGWEIPD
jgi:hypothetical protein